MPQSANIGGDPLPDGLRFGASPIHGTGVFAVRRFAAGERVVEYVGEIISQVESRRRCEKSNTFIFRLDEERDLDGNVEWNPARFVNHSCAPNCDAELLEGRIFLVARREIAAGKEITFNYGYDLEDYRDYPCHCGARECVGYMVAEEFFPDLRLRRE